MNLEILFRWTTYSNYISCIPTLFRILYLTETMSLGS